jgi:predicted ATP-dependent protease
MLRSDVREAAEAGQFHVYAVNDVDQAMEILTGLRAGEAGPDGAFPDGTVNQRVSSRLADLAEKRRKLSSKEETGAES